MGKTIDYSSLEIDGIEYSDYPDFCDAYISYGTYDDGTELSDEDYDELNDDDSLIFDLAEEELW